MKIDFIADTNFLIYVHEGNEAIVPFLDYDFGVSFVSEIELLGFKGITEEQEHKLTQLLSDCFCLNWNNRIKQQTIELRKKYTIKKCKFKGICLRRQAFYRKLIHATILDVGVDFAVETTLASKSYIRKT